MSERTHALQERPLSTLSDEEMIEAARQLSESPRKKETFLSSEIVTIAGSAQDQRVPDGVQNPYWEIVRYMPGMPHLFGTQIEPDGTWCLDRSVGVVKTAFEVGVDRFPLCARYSWAIPTPGDMAWLNRKLMGQAVVEIGAGSGYWAWQMTQAGIATAAFDPRKPGEGNWYNTHRLYHPVLEGDHTVAAGYPERALMISWPGYETNWAAQALSIFKGDTLVYVGEGMSGCCADDDFFADLEANWELDDECPLHVRYWGIHDELQVWRRRRLGPGRTRKALT